MNLAENKTLLGVIAILLMLFAVAVFFYNRTLNDLATGSCTDTSVSCPHEKVVETQNIVIAVLLLVIGLVVAWMAYQTYWKKGAGLGIHAENTGPSEAHIHTPTRKIDLSSLNPDEKKVVAIIQEKGGSAFQSDVISGTGFTKVKVSRILDRLEQRGLMERKRRGMANLVVLK